LREVALRSVVGEEVEREEKRRERLKELASSGRVAQKVELLMAPS
jgi:hypothetical protein